MCWRCGFDLKGLQGSEETKGVDCPECGPLGQRRVVRVLTSGRVLWRVIVLLLMAGVVADVVYIRFVTAIVILLIAIVTKDDPRFVRFVDSMTDESLLDWSGSRVGLSLYFRSKARESISVTRTVDAQVGTVTYEIVTEDVLPLSYDGQIWACTSYEGRLLTARDQTMDVDHFVTPRHVTASIWRGEVVRPISEDTGTIRVLVQLIAPRSYKDGVYGRGHKAASDFGEVMCEVEIEVGR